jgi:hypothetical protein
LLDLHALFIAKHRNITKYLGSCLTSLNVSSHKNSINSSIIYPDFEASRGHQAVEA